MYDNFLLFCPLGCLLASLRRSAPDRQIGLLGAELVGGCIYPPGLSRLVPVVRHVF
jgi:hypothetical protein